MALLFVLLPKTRRTTKQDRQGLIIYKKRVAGLTSAALANFVGRARRASGLRGEVNVLVAGNQELRSLNKAFRRKDVATDVLSFPAGGKGNFAGDVAISAQIASESAKRLGHSAAQEIKILALHGMLHLAGYDHEHDRGTMERKEARLRRILGLPVGLIERNHLKKADRIRKARAGRAGRPSSHTSR